MKISRIALPLVCLCTLASCGTKTTLEEFMEEAKKVEKHTYKKITIEYLSEKNDSIEEATVVYNLENDKYVPTEKNSYSNSLIAYAQQSIALVAFYDDGYFKNYEDDAKSIDDDAKVESDICYYINSFKVVGTFRASVNNENITLKRTIDFEQEYDKYGYLTFYESTTNYTYSKKSDNNKTSEKTKSHTKISITYKD
ncbi:MAG: hypothetical protein K6E21_06270 [Bacilli bacterium]|nr:hypothetical protein [Bacilli bacterium]